MRFVTWNCNGALRKKTEEIDSFGADVLVVQECEDPASSTAAYRAWAGNYLWIGSSKNKGLGVFPKKRHVVRPTGWHGSYAMPGVTNQSPASKWTSTDLKLFLPFVLNEQYAILGVWTKADGAKAFQYIGQFWKYLQIHRADLSRQQTLILGDFNSNVIWDKPDRWWNHSDVVDELSGMGLKSIYHHQTSEPQGTEKTPTFFLQRNETKAYHFDYAFASSDCLHQCQISVGDKNKWLNLSDHMPLCIDVDSQN